MYHIKRTIVFRCRCGIVHEVIEDIEDGGSDGDSLDFSCNNLECNQYYKKVGRIKKEQIISQQDTNVEEE